MPGPAPDFLEILTTLRADGVDFIVIGGVCAKMLMNGERDRAVLPILRRVLEERQESG